MHIAITGNIGAGKTSLTNLLASHYQWEAAFEPVESNPFLADFYQDMHRWAFHTQLHFLGSRFRQMQKINLNTNNLFQDRTIYEDAYIFARNLYTSGYLSEREYDAYLQLFESVVSLIRPPDLVIYLKASVARLMERIRKRGRAYEAHISETYIAHLNQNYEEWVSTYPHGKVLVFDANQLDFINKPGDLQVIIREIDQEIDQRFQV